MRGIDLNCDMGEGYPSDALLMPYISSANIACGYHAGDMDTMKRTVDLCLQYHVAIGAHPSYPDKENFGRTDMLGTGVSLKEIPSLIIEQINMLQAVCAQAGARLHHVKPHGALYNRAAVDAEVSTHICNAIASLDASLILYGLSGSLMETAARATGLQFRNEVFADRTYESNGTLRSRSAPGALITDADQSMKQVLQMINKGTVTAIDGKTIPMRAETICIHGDGPHAVEFAAMIARELKNNGIIIQQ
ncbi:MAG TPA: 5-oxoprolinase subunit PxpA [Chitinophagaceae bacterium]|nr:5-oxoprolinase subunit PxpA [Chitinophagaceae bacterium]